MNWPTLMIMQDFPSQSTPDQGCNVPLATRENAYPGFRGEPGS